MHPKSKFSILLADDDDDDLNILSAVLEAHPQFTVVGRLTNGPRIIDWMNEGVKPDIIMTDMYMPMMTGTEVIDRLASTDSIGATRIIIFSTICNEAEEDKYKMMDNVAFFTKPDSLKSYGELAGKILDCFFL